MKVTVKHLFPELLRNTTWESKVTSHSLNRKPNKQWTISQHKSLGISILDREKNSSTIMSSTFSFYMSKAWIFSPWAYESVLKSLRCTCFYLATFTHKVLSFWDAVTPITTHHMRSHPNSCLSWRFFSTSSVIELSHFSVLLWHFVMLSHHALYSALYMLSVSIS